MACQQGHRVNLYLTLIVGSTLAEALQYSTTPPMYGTAGSMLSSVLVSDHCRGKGANNRALW
eukprot:2357099-Amphidinium_carterae.1